MANVADVTGLDGLGVATEGLPLGTILPSILPPRAFLAHARPQNAWMLANGDRLPNQSSPLAVFMKANNQRFYDDSVVNNDIAHVPNLRGAFLRAVDAEPPSGRDPAGLRKIGHYQEDAFARHSHKLGQQSQAIVHFQGDVFVRPGGDNYPTTELGGDETRPKNIAVYFYIRVS